MIKPLFTFLTFSFIMGAVLRPSFSEEIARPAQVTLDAELVRLLNKRYPGFRLADKKDYCRNFERQQLPFVGSDGRWAYGALKGDFNGDRLEDYSLIIRTGGRYLWLAALKTSESQKPYEVSEFGEPVIQVTTLPPRKFKGKICDVFVVGGPGKAGLGLQDANSNPFDYIGLENGAEGRQYFWKDGRWHQTGFEP